MTMRKNVTNLISNLQIPATAKQVAGFFGYKRGYIRDILNNLVEEGKVNRILYGKEYVYLHTSFVYLITRCRDCRELLDKGE